MDFYCRHNPNKTNMTTHTRFKQGKQSIFVTALMLLTTFLLTASYVAQAHRNAGTRIGTITITNTSNVDVDELYIYLTGTKPYHGKIHVSGDGVLSPGEVVQTRLEIYVDNFSSYTVYASSGGLTLVDMEHMKINPGEHFHLDWGSFTNISTAPVPSKWCSAWEKNWYPNCSNDATVPMGEPTYH